MPTFIINPPLLPIPSFIFEIFYPSPLKSKPLSLPLNKWRGVPTILSLPLLELGLKYTSFSPGLCIHSQRQHRVICWEFHFWISCCFLMVDCLGGWNQMWLVSSRRWGMLNPSVSWPSHHSSTFLRLVLVYQVYHAYCIVIKNDEGWDSWGVVDLY